MEVILSVKLIKAVPTELIIAFAASHKFAATRPNNVNVARRAFFWAKGFVNVCDYRQLCELDVFPISNTKPTLTSSSLGRRTPLKSAACTLELNITMNFIERIICLIRIKPKALAFFIRARNELVRGLKHAFCDCEAYLLEENWIKWLLKVFDGKLVLTIFLTAFEFKKLVYLLVCSTIMRSSDTMRLRYVQSINCLDSPLRDTLHALCCVADRTLNGYSGFFFVVSLWLKLQLCDLFKAFIANYAVIVLCKGINCHEM